MVATALQLVSVCLAAGIFFAFFRLIQGPSLGDRLVSLDLIGTQVVGLLVIDMIRSGETHNLIPAMILAIIMFLGTAVFALFYEKGIRE